MKRIAIAAHTASLTLGLFALLAASVAAAKSAASPLRVGAARVDITPAGLTGLNPFGGSFASVNDHIYARVLLIANATTKAAIVSTDLIEVGDMDPLRRRIEREVGIPFDNIMISATHDHSAPRIGAVSPGALAHPGDAQVTAYTSFAFDRVVQGVKQAVAAEQPARFGIATGRADINVNRDQYTPKGWVMGFNPDGPSDKTVWVAKFETLDGKPIAVLLNYAVHNTATVGTRILTGDLAGVAERYVEASLGNQAVALWTMGAAGDQNPRIFPDEKPGAVPDVATVFRAADAQGVMVGAEAVRVAAGITRMSAHVRLAAAAWVATCPSKPGVKQMADMTRVTVPAIKLRLGVIVLNDTAFTGVAGEVVTSIYAHLRRASPLASTLMITISNDRVGYIADDAAYDRPTHEVNGDPMARGCAEDAIADGLSDMIRQLQLQ